MKQIDVGLSSGAYLNDLYSNNLELNKNGSNSDFKNLLQENNRKKDHVEKEQSDVNTDIDNENAKTDNLINLAHQLAMKKSDEKLKENRLNLTSNIDNVSTKKSMLSNTFDFLQSSHALGQFDNASLDKDNKLNSIVNKNNYGIELSESVVLFKNNSTTDNKSTPKTTSVKYFSPAITSVTKYQNSDKTSPLPRQRNEVFQLPAIDMQEFKKSFLKVIDTGDTIRLLYRDFSNELNFNTVDSYFRQNTLFNKKPIQLIYNGFKGTINAS